MCAEITLRLGQIIGYTQLISRVEVARQRKHNVNISDYEYQLRQVGNFFKKFYHKGKSLRYNTEL